MALSAVLKQSVVAPVVALFAMGSLHAQGPMRQSLDIMVPNAPVHVEVAGVAQITYELHLTNFARDSLRLTRVQLLAGRGGDAVAALEGPVSGLGHRAHRGPRRPGEPARDRARGARRALSRPPAAASPARR
jgi:hypothetical protein